tara:strand:+ start:325 stop:1212 length:888 start_codon:yes stop_codon:yes gene_type:complete
MRTKIAFIGLGAMGFPMAGHLARAKYNVSVFNRTVSKSDSWLEQFKGRKGRTIAETVFDSEFVFSCVGNDQDLREIFLGDDGAVANLKKGAIIVDHTTTSAQVAVDVGKDCEKHGIFFLDAPVSGGQDGAIKGELSVMCGGDLDAFLKAQIVMESYARNIVRIGGIGQGQLTKMVNQICIAGLLQGLSEGIAFATNAGLDCERVIDAISGGAAGSWQMQNRAASMIKGKYDFGFAVELMRKDLGICISEAVKNGSELPVTELVDSFYSEIQQNGGHRLDTSSLLSRLPVIHNEKN